MTGRTTGAATAGPTGAATAGTTERRVAYV